MTVPATAAENIATVSARCRELRAEAQSVAAVLRAPRLEVAAVRPPRIGDISGTGAFPNSDFQVRTVVAYPALDLFRGNSTLNTADAECRRVLAVQDAAVILEQGSHYGEIPALRAQIDIISSGLPKVDTLVAESRQRLDRGLITVMDSDDLQLRRLRLESTLGMLKHELAVLESQSAPVEMTALKDAVGRYEAASMTAREEASFLRKLSAWRVDLQLGGIPYPQPDWYGMVSVAYNIGGIVQGPAEAEALAAGRENLAKDRDELRARAEQFTRIMRDSAVGLGEELTLLDRQLTLVQQRLDSVQAESDRMRQAVASFEVERIELQGRRAYVEKLRAVREAAGRALE